MELKMLLKSKKNTSLAVKPKKIRKQRAKKADKNESFLPEVETLMDKLNRKELVNRLNHTNSKLKEVGLLSSDESEENLLKHFKNISVYV